MADNVEIQGLGFEVVGETEGAINGLNKLSSSLNKLQTATNGGLGLTAVSREIKEVSEASENTDSGNLSAMSTALQSITASSHRLSTVRDNLQAISELDFSNLASAADYIGNVAESSGLARSSVAQTETVSTPVLNISALL